jgi:hypothetical protein
MVGAASTKASLQQLKKQLMTWHLDLWSRLLEYHVLLRTMERDQEVFFIILLDYFEEMMRIL